MLYTKKEMSKFLKEITKCISKTSISRDPWKHLKLKTVEVFLILNSSNSYSCCLKTGLVNFVRRKSESVEDKKSPKLT